MKCHTGMLCHDSKSNRDILLVERMKTNMPFWIAEDYDFETFLIVCEYNLKKVEWSHME